MGIMNAHNIIYVLLKVTRGILCQKQNKKLSAKLINFQKNITKVLLSLLNYGLMNKVKTEIVYGGVMPQPTPKLEI